MSSFAQISRKDESEVRPPKDHSNALKPALFSGILSDEYAVITSRARVRVFERGEMLHLKGEPVQQVLLLTAGYAKVTQFGSGGAEVILRLGVPGDVLGASGLFSGGNHYTTAQASGLESGLYPRSRPRRKGAFRNRRAAPLAA